MCFFQRRSFPQAIAHIDCNAFFASVEQAYNPKLKGKPVLVTGMGGSCVITASYEARKFNISIGTPIWEARKICPDAVVLPANFKRYLLYHQNFIEIVRSFTPDLEAASIDECYIDLTGLRRLYREPYSATCFKIKETVKQKLGISVSVGLSTSKVLAKIASNHKKPDGLTVVSGKEIEKFLSGIALEKVKGLGVNTRALLNKQGIYTPLEFVFTPEKKIKKLLGKIGWEMQMEMRGFSVRPIVIQSALPKSLARTRSFSVSNNKQFIYQELLSNLAIAFWQLRRQKLKTSFLTVMLRTKDYKVYGQEIAIPEEINSDLAILPVIKAAFEKLFNPNYFYRSSGIITTRLQHQDLIPQRLFTNQFETPGQISLFEKIDQINLKHGHSTIRIASTAPHQKDFKDLSKLYLPFLGSAN